MDLCLHSLSSVSISSLASHRLFTTPAPSAKLLVSVIVPVKNEAARLHGTLEALRLQEDAAGQRINTGVYEVLILVNNSTDASYQIARDYQLEHPEFSLLIADIVIQICDAHIGTVRRKLMDEAHSRLTDIGRRRGIIASTDGDSIVDRKWIHHITEEISKGNDAVGGRIYTPEPEFVSRHYFERNEKYRLLVTQAESLIDPMPDDPWPSHFQYFGASLAVTCEMYEKAGRLPIIPFLEDEAFHRALYASDAKIRRSPNVKVFTSSRLDGRVEVGFSEQLCTWRKMVEHNKPQYAESPEDIISRFTHRRLLRDYWSDQLSSPQNEPLLLRYLASSMGVDIEWLRSEARNAMYFGKFWQHVEAKSSANRKGLKPVLITRAIRELARFIRAFKPGKSF